MFPNAVLTRARSLIGPLLIVLLAAVAPTVAQGHRHPHPHPHPGGASTAAPATTAVPPSTTAPASTTQPAPAAAPAPAPAVAPATSTSTDAAPPPTLGQTVALATVSGTVTVRVPGGGSVALTSAATLPTGTRIDTRDGEVELRSALDAAGHTQTGRFSGGVFEVRQPKDRKGLTQIVLAGGDWAGCRTSGYVSRAAKATKKKARKPIRKLWGQDSNGSFETRGGGSVATVRGTRWLTTDTCDGTRTTVLEGAVSVKSRATGATKLVRAGQTLFVKR
ncbi:hypothetical protein [Baekduia sp. Peel2402]|uniref:hypothetical protein n=1 Tax=Baekduia sp. Peel2402 TaxID=3458296 RepID=UPI00403EE16D